MHTQPFVSRFEWPLGTRVRKIKGSSWRGVVVGFYTTDYTPEGYCVESELERGSVQIYPRGALELVPNDVVADPLQAYIEALTPSAHTKMAYMGEVEFTIEDGDGRLRDVFVPWTQIKEIMEMIRAYAKRQIEKGSRTNKEDR